MIDNERKIIYVDYSTLATFQSCKEKARLGYVEGYRHRQPHAALSFGHAFHAALAAYYDALAGGARHEGRWRIFNEGEAALAPVKHAQRAFLRDLKIEGAELPAELEAEERRSIERGIALVGAYIHRWQSEPYENIPDANGAPLAEVGFRYSLGTFRDFEIVYVGFIDRIMRNVRTQRPVIVEHKTTTQALSVYIASCKPNHQVTGYFPAANNLIPGIHECVWDCIYVSNRKADPSKVRNADSMFWQWGIDAEKDFQRQLTTRSQMDVSEFLWDANQWAQEYCEWLFKDAKRWPRSAPGACHGYGGCQFRPVCAVNGDQNYLNTFFEVKPWEPWRATEAALASPEEK